MCLYKEKIIFKAGRERSTVNYTNPKVYNQILFITLKYYTHVIIVNFNHNKTVGHQWIYYYLELTPDFHAL